MPAVRGRLHAAERLPLPLLRGARRADAERGGGARRRPALPCAPGVAHVPGVLLLRGEHGGLRLQVRADRAAQRDAPERGGCEAQRPRQHRRPLLPDRAALAALAVTLTARPPLRRRRGDRGAGGLLGAATAARDPRRHRRLLHQPCRRGSLPRAAAAHARLPVHHAAAAAVPLRPRGGGAHREGPQRAVSASLRHAPQLLLARLLCQRPL